ncbi:hypothetical protein P7C70_g7131, partial [Phenoliferia sp. Uapishka_3]
MSTPELGQLCGREQLEGEQGEQYELGSTSCLRDLPPRTAFSLLLPPFFSLPDNPAHTSDRRPARNMLSSSLKSHSRDLKFDKEATGAGRGLWVKLEAKKEASGKRVSSPEVGWSGEEGREVTHVEYRGSWSISFFSLSNLLDLRSHELNALFLTATGIPNSPSHLLSLIRSTPSLPPSHQLQS